MTDTADRLKHLLIDALHLDIGPDEIDPEAPLFGEGLGLDSVDALELVVAMEKEFGIQTETEEIGREHFASLNALAAFVDARAEAARQAAEG